MLLTTIHKEYSKYWSNYQRWGLWNSQGAQSPEPASWSWIRWSQQSISITVSSLKLGSRAEGRNERRPAACKSFGGREENRVFMWESRQGRDERERKHPQTDGTAEIPTSVQWDGQTDGRTVLKTREAPSRTRNGQKQEAGTLKSQSFGHQNEDRVEDIISTKAFPWVSLIYLFI